MYVDNELSIRNYYKLSNVYYMKSELFGKIYSPNIECTYSKHIIF